MEKISVEALNEVLTKLPTLSKRYEFAVEKLKNAFYNNICQ